MSKWLQTDVKDWEPRDWLHSALWGAALELAVASLIVAACYTP